MKRFDRDELSQLLQDAGTKARLRRELRFNADAVDWSDVELLAIADRTERQGALVMELGDERYVVSYGLRAKTADKIGRNKPITCDFCYTWQRGSYAARISFKRRSDEHITSFLCCGDLRCSLHVRDKTPEARFSRTQLHEDMTVDQRIARLRGKLRQLVEALQLEPVDRLPGIAAH